MKKLFLTMMIASCLLAACGEKKEDAVTPAPAPTVTTSYTVDYSTACSDEAMAAIKAYHLTLNPELTDEEFNADFATRINYIKKANELGLDRNQYYTSILSAIGGDQAIEDLKADNVAPEYIDFVLAENASKDAIYTHMKDANMLENAEKDYFLENYLRAKHVLINTEGMDETQKAEAKVKADDILARANAGEDFNALVTEFSEDPGSAQNPDGYVFTTGAMVPEFEDGTRNTEIGKFTLVESTYGYHVIQRLALDETPELFEQFLAQVAPEFEQVNPLDLYEIAMDKFVSEPVA